MAAVYTAQAFVEERKGNTAAAVELLKRAIDLEPDPGIVWLYHCDLATLYKGRADYAAAISHFTKGIQLLEPNVSPEFRRQIEAEVQECRQKAEGAGS
jgi:tetratricopeptide (TPR) repeat protein